MPSVDKDVEKGDTCVLLEGRKLVLPLWKTVGMPLKKLKI